MRSPPQSGTDYLIEMAGFIESCFINWHALVMRMQLPLIQGMMAVLLGLVLFERNGDEYRGLAA